jgi:4-hydroxymandelate oxidase
VDRPDPQGVTAPVTPALLNLFDYETLAEARMPAALWDYVVDGAGDGVTLAANRRAFERVRLRPRVLADVSRVDTAARVLGQPMSAPIMVAPAAHGAMCEGGDLAAARAARRAGVAMVAASGSAAPIEAIAAAPSGPLWLQLYLYPERERTLALVRRAEAAGCTAIALTVDSPVYGRKERSLRSENGYDWPDHGNLAGLPPPTSSPVRGAPATWADVDWLLAATRLPLVLKGVLAGEDAAMAAARGVAGVVVSNHGGRQLDGAMASLDALPDVVAAVAGRCEVYLDGGVRRGVDVVRALALGARAVLVGRPVLWGLAIGGEDGAFDVLDLLRRELVAAMALCGRASLAEIDRALLAP